MRIAAVHSPQGKIFGTVEGDSFRPFSVGGGIAARPAPRHQAGGRGHSRREYGAPVALGRVKLAAPVGPLAKNVICVGKNYHDHAQEFARSGVDQSGDKQEVPADPVIFTKSTSSLADPGQKICRVLGPDPHGRLRRRVRRRHRQALPRTSSARTRSMYVFGYTIVNDVTARAVQQRHKQWFLGKSLDGFCPVGPYLVTRDEFGVPDEQELATYVNDERRQFAKLRDMIFDVPTFIETVTAYVPLGAGRPAGHRHAGRRRHRL